MIEYLLIGGGLASSEAVKQIRALDETGSIVLVSEEPHLPYDRPPLTKEYLRGETERDSLLYADARFFEEGRIQTVLGVRVESLDLAAKAASLSNGNTVSFEKALIATGGRPIRLPLSGEDKEGVHYLRTMDDAEAIGGEARSGKRAVLIGAGFIGLEAAASLTQRGVHVTVIESLPHIWPRFADEALAAHFQDYCEARGVTFLVNDSVGRIEGGARASSVVTSSGREVPCDLICVAVGIRPNVELAEAAGLAVDNGVTVDEGMRTSHPDVYAAGDIVNYPDPVFGRRRVEHWGHAEYGGQVAGKNMAGGDAKYDLLSYVWSDIFDLHLEFAGDESEHDSTVVRGSMEQGSFTVLYLKDGLLRAYFAVNTEAREFPVFQRLIRRKKDLSGLIDQLQDTSVNLRGLL